jgi:hypothetical protein
MGRPVKNRPTETYLHQHEFLILLRPKSQPTDTTGRNNKKDFPHMIISLPMAKEPRVTRTASLSPSHRKAGLSLAKARPEGMIGFGRIISST